jgi:asparagine synthase (glutamine-hydrolysing)
MARLRAWANDGLAGPRAPHFAERIAFTSLRGFVAEFNNMRVDKMCMAMSIEARSPFEDRAMVDLALSLPLAYKLRRGDFKRVLKDAVRDLVPAAVLTRPKWGFMPPASEWLRTSLRPLVETYLAPDRVAAVGVFRPDAIAALVSGHMERRSYALYPVWSALVFMLWHAFYIEGEPVPGGALTPEGVAAGAVIERGQATSPRARG